MSGPFLLATRSAGKLRELRPMFADAGIAIVDLDDVAIMPSAEEDTLERFETFEENAFAKAHYFLARSGLPTIADDSGLEVHSLNGAPGVRSKRWSGRTDLSGQALDDANNAALVSALAAQSDRSARYVCVAAYADWTTGFSARGESSGTIVDASRGVSGFGYDPYFLSAELGVTFGEAERAAKQTISHRGRAFRELCEKIRGRAGDRTR